MYSHIYPKYLNRQAWADLLNPDQTGNQEVRGLIPTGPTAFFHGDSSANIFYSQFLPSADLRWTDVS